MGVFAEVNGEESGCPVQASESWSSTGVAADAQFATAA